MNLILISLLYLYVVYIEFIKTKLRKDHFFLNSFHYSKFNLLKY
jgi:hypothetical protein